MQVERVHTANYLGRKYVSYTQGNRPGRWGRGYVAGDEWEGCMQWLILICKYSTHSATGPEGGGRAE